MLNNRGQSLVMFILIIPILLGIMVLVIDIGNVIYYKNDIDNINKIVIDYGLSHVNDDSVLNDMRELGKLNKDKLNLEIKFVDMEFYSSGSYYVSGVFSNIFNTRGYLVKSDYKGYLDNNRHIIKKIK